MGYKPTNQPGPETYANPRVWGMDGQRVFEQIFVRETVPSEWQTLGVYEAPPNSVCRATVEIVSKAQGRAAGFTGRFDLSVVRFMDEDAVQIGLEPEPLHCDDYETWKGRVWLNKNKIQIDVHGNGAFPIDWMAVIRVVERAG